MISDLSSFVKQILRFFCLLDRFFSSLYNRKSGWLPQHDFTYCTIPQEASLS